MSTLRSGARKSPPANSPERLLKRSLRLAAFPPQAAFLPALAQAWLAAAAGQGDDPADGTIILPNRRAARALAGAFLHANHGQALLLPRIIAIGNLDETALTLAQGLALPPAIPPMQRQAMLAGLILKMGGGNGAPTRLAAAWALAADLATLLDEADYAEIDLATALPGVVAAELAAHWQITLRFLTIVTHLWPAILAERGMVNPARRQVMLVAAQNAAWVARPPAAPVWLAARRTDPSLGRLARTVAGLPAGLVLLPGYDPALSDAAWEALDDSHGQAGLARLLGAIGARRDEIEMLAAPASAVPPGRAALLSRALLPAACLTDWQSPAPLDTAGLLKLAARDEQEDATAIAMALREALEMPGRSIALVTPDRPLAVRVAAALRRFGIAANDSAGEPLAETPPAVFLRLLGRAAAAAFAPLPLLALLKHPLTAAGLPPEVCRAAARRLELAALRGPRPPPGFAGIRYELERDDQSASVAFVARLEMLLAPVAAAPLVLGPAAALQALVQAAEALAATEAQGGAARLWGGEAGPALSALLQEALAALAGLPEITADETADLLDAVLAGQVIRRPRTHDAHPRIAIWGVQEAMLQSVDMVMLAGLNEGVWPAGAEPGPWLSRPMRRAAGLPSPEQELGLAAQDFFALAASCATVVLAAPVRRERAPAVPARWLTRLEAMLAGDGQALAPHPAASWAAQLDLPARRQPRDKPRPCPPAARRPRELSISEIADLLADPYTIYARRILDIRPLDALDEETDQTLFGNIVHDGLAAFFTVQTDFSTADAAAALTGKLQLAMRARRPRAALQHWWEARLARIAGWIVEAERLRRQVNPPVAMRLEGSATLALPGGFSLRSRADRIEKRRDGSVMVMDYKTGTPPTAKQVEQGSKPQLPLEAVMVEAGAFGAALQAGVTELAYWKLTGRHIAGSDKLLFKDPGALRDVIDEARERLLPLFETFADQATPYLARPHPGRATYRDVYAGISRSGEWRGEGEAEDA